MTARCGTYSGTAIHTAGTLGVQLFGHMMLISRVTSSIVDFEHWDTRTVSCDDITSSQKERELQRWGVVQRPPPATWAHEWGLIR